MLAKDDCFRCFVTSQINNFSQSCAIQTRIYGQNTEGKTHFLLAFVKNKLYISVSFGDTDVNSARIFTGIFAVESAGCQLSFDYKIDGYIMK